MGMQLWLFGGDIGWSSEELDSLDLVSELLSPRKFVEVWEIFPFESYLDSTSFSLDLS